MHRTFAIVIVVCSLAAGALAASTGHYDGALQAVLGIGAGLWIWSLDHSRRARTDQYLHEAVQRAARQAERGAELPGRRDYKAVLDAADRNLRSSGFAVSRNVVLPDHRIASLVASRDEFTLPGARRVRIVEHLFLRRRPTATAADFDDLFEQGFREVGGSPGWFRLWPPRSGRLILPCLVVDSATPELIAFASGRPPRRWMRFEFPVLYDLSTGIVHYCRETPALGAMFFPSARALVGVAFDIA